MTSGIFTTFPIDQVWVDRAERQRKELTDIPELAASIRDNGLIHPPVIRRDGKLIVGERRWTAMKSLGWTAMPVQFVDELSEIELQALEYEENAKRVNLPWQEQCQAVANYHRLRQEQNSEWSIQQTAERLGFAVRTAYEVIDVAKGLADNKRVAEAPKFSTARQIVRRENIRKADAALTTISTDPETPTRTAPLLNVEFGEWARTYEGPKFNFLHCDFPYGVGMDKSAQGAGASFGTYADSENVYWELLQTLSSNLDRVVTENAHLMFWFSMDFYSETKTALTEMGWKISPFPLIWMKSDNTGIIPDANRGPRRIYETAFMGSRGDRPIVSPVSNAFAHPGREKSIHMNEKPQPMLKHFLRMFVDQYSTVLDPTCGSANVLKAAQELGAPHVLGLERDLEFFTRASEAYYGSELTL